VIDCFRRAGADRIGVLIGWLRQQNPDYNPTGLTAEQAGILNGLAIPSSPPALTPTPQIVATSPHAAGSDVPLVESDGDFRVPANINGQITLKFTVDSGASDVLIPADVVVTLFRTETLSPNDFIGKQTYVLANGTKVPSERFILRQLRVGDHVVTNVTASVGPVESTPLLGRSFLSHFASWTVDNNRHVLILSETQSPPPQAAQPAAPEIARIEPPPPASSTTSCGTANDQLLRPVQEIYRAINQRDIDLYARQWADNGTYRDIFDGGQVKTKAEKIESRRKSFVENRFSITMDRPPEILSRSAGEAQISVYYSMSITFPDGVCKRRAGVLERYTVSCIAGQWQILDNTDEINVTGPSTRC
jgi:clan AA aspartic protease (TIGR02281 family)